MIIERIKDQIIIKIPASVETEDLQDFVDYIRYKELTSDIEVSQSEIDKLASEINQYWWSKNKDRFIQ
jgi:hypothetical protein